MSHKTNSKLANDFIRSLANNENSFFSQVRNFSFRLQFTLKFLGTATEDTQQGKRYAIPSNISLIYVSKILSQKSDENCSFHDVELDVLYRGGFTLEKVHVPNTIAELIYNQFSLPDHVTKKIKPPQLEILPA